MNREDIIRMAREADLVTKQFAYGGYSAEHTDWLAARFERFAVLVAAAEREACADVCSGHYDTAQAANAIRARGEK
jgi:hypothetical protein